jgi:hypothetical protein
LVVTDEREKMLTKEQLAQGLELTQEQATVLFDLIETGKVDGALHLAADILGTSVQSLSTNDNAELLSFVQMTSEDVATLIYEHPSQQFSVGTLTSWLENNQDKLSNTPVDDEDEIADDEPYVMLYWPNGDILAAQIDGLKELIAEQGEPEKYEIVTPPLDIFGE